MKVLAAICSFYEYISNSRVMAGHRNHHFLQFLSFVLFFFSQKFLCPKIRNVYPRITAPI